MGDRVSIQFRQGQEKSIVLFDHWGGMARVEHAEEYVKKLTAWARKERAPNSQGGRITNPLTRLEPAVVIFDYIRTITQNLNDPFSGDPFYQRSIYLRATENEGDNSDNGHHIIELEEME